MAGEKLAVSEEEAARVMQAFQQSAQAAREKRAREAAEKNKKEGEAFLAANKKKPGVVALPSGLQYKVLKEGTGKSPKATDMVTVHYRGTLIDGTEFDSSYSRNEPATFEVGQIIPGWVEALQLMKAGAKWQLFIPSELAYGEQGAGPQIGPNSVLLFEVELLSIGQPRPPSSRKSKRLTSAKGASPPPHIPLPETRARPAGVSTWPAPTHRYPSPSSAASQLARPRFDARATRCYNRREGALCLNR